KTRFPPAPTRQPRALVSQLLFKAAAAGAQRPPGEATGALRGRQPPYKRRPEAGAPQKVFEKIIEIGADLISHDPQLVLQRAAPLAGEGQRGGQAVAAGAGDGPGGVALAAHAQSG